MNTHFRSLGLLLAVLLLAGSTALAQKAPDELEYPPLNEVQLPDVERVELDNGLLLFLVEDHELPLINLSARIGVGSIHEPADKTGLATITGSVMRTGGTTNRSGDEIDLMLESIGASVETGIGETSGTASMSVLKDDLDTGLDILADLLMNPAFPEDKIELEKVQERTAIARRNDNAQSIAFREFNTLIYGADSPYANQTEYATIDAVTRDDIVAFYEAYYHPNNTMIGVWGDFDTDEMVEKIKTAFSGWEKEPSFTRPEAPDVDYTYDTSLNLIDKSDVNQSVVLMGHLGGERDNPDYFALQVMNSILGGGFASRLFSRVRSDQGLAYAVFGSYDANYDYPGQFYAGVMTKSESTLEAVRSVKREIENMRTEPVTDAELNLAKESYLNSFVFNFDTRGEVINRLMTYEYYGYPADFLQQTKEGIEQVSKEDVQRVAQEYLQPDKMRLLVVGNSDNFDEPLSTLGPVNEIDITIPSPADDVPEATDEALAAGRTKLDDAIEAAGGQEAFTSIESVRLTGTMTIPQMGGDPLDFMITMVIPGRFAMNLSTPMGTMKQTYSEGEASMSMGDQEMPAQPGMQEQLENALWQDLTYLFASADQVTVQDLGQQELNGTTYEALRITPPSGAPYTLYLDPETMLVAGMTAQTGPATVETTYTDYQDVEGRKVPFQSSTTQDGQEGPSATLSSVEFNVDVDEDLFPDDSQ